jgi:GNAT superfamily N-acetyltransferase
MASFERAVTLRPADAEDATAIARIWHEGWRDGHVGHVSDDLVAHRTAESFEARAAQRVNDTVVATINDAIAGFVTVIRDEVEQIYVSRERRGSGVAAVLLAEAERVVRLNGYQRAWLAVIAGNTRARKFYERNGWTDEGLFDYSAEGTTGPMVVPAHRYVKRLVN